MKAQNETEALQAMASMFKRGGGKLSGRNERWTLAKVRALDSLMADFEPLPPRPLQILDLGIGDMILWANWEPFDDEGLIEYLGIEGCPDILETGKQRFPDRQFILRTFGEVVAQHVAGFVWLVDAMVALDVLYHIPEDDIYEGMRAMLFGPGDHSYVLVSYSKAHDDRFDSAKDDRHPGYSWFPRVWAEPEGWEQLHRETFCAPNQPQRQELTLYLRS